MIFSRLHFLPIILFLFIIGTIILTYIVSVSLDHVRPFFPYISDTGTIPPESTIFAQLLNIGSVFIFITFYLRCKEVKTLYSDPKLPRYSTVVRLNRISLWLSFPVALGTSMAANFQETDAFIPHMIGAFGCFTLGMLYFWLHTFISYITCPVLNTLNMARLRLLITIAGSLFCSGTALFGVLAYLDFTREISDFPKWGPDDGGYELHLVSTFSEWLTLIFYGLYILTFVREFKDLVMQSPKLEQASNTIAHRVDYGSQEVNINSLDNMDRKTEDNNGNYGKAIEIGKGGSKILLV